MAADGILRWLPRLPDPGPQEEPDLEGTQALLALIPVTIVVLVIILLVATAKVRPPRHHPGRRKDDA